MLIVTNFRSFPSEWRSTNGVVGRSVFAESVREFQEAGNHAPGALWLVNCHWPTVSELARHKSTRARMGARLVAVDLVLRKPASLLAKLAAMRRRRVMKSVDLFINYFRDTSAIDAIYGIGERSIFVPFKANLWKLRSPAPAADGDYVLCFGRSLRDFDTFFDAMERVGCPGVIVDPRSSQPWVHGSRFTRAIEALPSNVRIVPDGTSEQFQADLLRNARLVAVPVVPESVVASGISTILNAMAMGKCVIATAGPGVTDIFDDELLSVPPEAPGRLADTIQRAWDDEPLRRRTATAGHAYATRCGTEQDMFQRIIDCVADREFRPVQSA
jgi:glycosyltransferase involved in cell wall biosynthesis